MARDDFNKAIEGMAWADRYVGRINLRVILPVAAVVLFFIAWNRGVALLYGSFWLLAGLYGVAWLYPRMGLRALSVERRLPETAHEGETIEVRYDIRNRSPWRRYLVELWDRLPFARDEQMVLLPRVGRSVRIDRPVLCDLRGVHTLGEIRLRSGFPLGIDTAESQVKTPMFSLVVYPKPEPVARLFDGADLSSRVSNDFYTERAGGHEEFMAVREYRQGDSPRYIHWPTTARKRELIVREFHENSARVMSIVLDLNQTFDVGHRHDSVLEYSVKIAASLGCEALGRGWRVNLFGIGRQPLNLTGLTGEKERMRLLEALAYVRCDGETPYAAVLERAVSQGMHGGTVVLFERDDAPLRADALARRAFFVQRYTFIAESFARGSRPVETAETARTRHGIRYRVRKGIAWAQLFA
jgi:uncharacterized protein (DUF58 family)